MVPPPPSQAGKFKPRKPAKKIRTGTAVPEAGVVPDAQPSAPAAGESRSGGGGRGGRSQGGRGGGRGGRGMRAPAPQGAVFFTGAPAASETRGSSAAASQVRRARAAVSAASSSAGRGTVKVKREGNDNTQEEVVGILETSIGAGAVPSDVKSNSLLKDDADFDKPRDNSDFGKSGGVDFYFYDSDESLKDGRSDSRTRKKDQIMEPLVLPFKKDVNAVETVGSMETKSATQSIKALSLEDTNWILVQLPTRLPPLQQNKTEGDEPEGDVAIKSEEDEQRRDDIAEVVTPPVHYDRFDNSLVNATPGRLGRIRIFKSGKAVLLFEDPKGAPMVQMNVAEGLRCSFRQEAVAIDTEGGTLSQLGEVNATLVVTPDLTKAFQA